MVGISSAGEAEGTTIPATRTDVSIATSTHNPSDVSQVLLAINAVIEPRRIHRTREHVKAVLQH